MTRLTRSIFLALILLLAGTFVACSGANRFETDKATGGFTPSRPASGGSRPITPSGSAPRPRSRSGNTISCSRSSIRFSSTPTSGPVWQLRPA